MSEDWKAYVNDKRTVCKYGSKCYQKNAEHHAQYKHPPLNVKGRKNNHRLHPYKRESVEQHRVDNENTTSPILKVEENNSSKTEQSAETQNVETERLTININKEVTFLSNTTGKELFKELFLVEMPADFFKFYTCLSQDNNPEKTLSSVNLQMIGPYELLAGKLPKLEDKELYLVHWRFFYDPPEFQSVLKVKGKDELHFGYYRDDPNNMPVFVGSNDSAKSCQINPLADNIFGAVYQYLINDKNHSPFTAMACKQLAVKVRKWAEDNKFSIQEYDMKKRQAKIVTKTFHGAGIVVPYDKRTQLGYRKLVDSNANIKKIFTKLEKASSPEEKDKVLSELQPVITYANIAVDECDFGTGLELGINLLCSGLKELEHSVLGSLCSVYSLLNREAFGKIIQAHLKYRRRGPEMSVLSLKT